MANTASRLSANGSLTISGSFDEVVGGVTTRGLVAYLDANKVESYPGYGKTWIDLSGNKNDGAINGNVVFVANGTSSYFNWPTIQNDSNYISGANSFNYQDFTIVFYPDPASTYAFATLFSTAPASTQNDKSLRAISQGSGAQWYISNSGDGNDWSSNAVAANTVYYLNGSIAPPVNISSVYKGIYINAGTWNILGGSKSTNQFPSSWSYYLGSGGYPGRGWQGRIAAALFYDRPLSQSEQIKNYNYFAQRFGIAANTTPTVSQITANSTTNIIQYQSNNFNEVDYNPNNIGPTKNLFQNSEDFNQQFAWLIANGTVTKNQALAPDNTQTASLFSAIGQYPLIYYYPPGGFSGYKLVEPGKFYTQSMFVKYVNQSRCTFVTESWPIDGAIQFDLLTGSLASSLNGPITGASITPFPNGWWRISATYLIPSRSDASDPNQFFWNPQWRLGNYDGTNYSGSQMLVWGAQLEEGNTASTYVATDFPKNILLFTDELTTPSTYYWQSQNITITKNATISPDENYNGFLLSSTINGGSNTCFLQRQKFNLPINTNYTYSVYLKQGTSPTTFLNFYNVSPFTELVATITWPAIYGNAPTVSYSGGATRLASTITDAGNGWWRFSLSMNNGSSSGLMWRVYVTTNGVTNVIGNSVYVWGPQLEFGLTPTTLIRNTGNYTNTLPLANTNMVMKTTNTGNTFVKGTYDEYSKMSPITEGLIFNIDPGYDTSYTGSGSTMYDTTQNRYRVDLSGSPPYSSDFGGILKFTSTFGNNAWANTNFPARTITPTSNYTMSAWVKFNRSNSGLAEFQYYNSSTFDLVSPQANTGYSYGSAGTILGTNYYGDYGLFWQSQIRTSGQKQLLVGFQNRVTPYNEASPQLAYTMNDSLIFFNWTHIVGVLNNAGNFAGFYVNGVLVNSTTASQIASGSFPYTYPTVRICADNVAGSSAIPRNFDGDIGPMSIWNRALSASEIQQMYNSQRSRFGV
jgi:hypothetical protein